MKSPSKKSTGKEGEKKFDSLKRWQTAQKAIRVYSEGCRCGGRALEDVWERGRISEDLRMRSRRGGRERHGKGLSGILSH